MASTQHQLLVLLEQLTRQLPLPTTTRSHSPISSSKGSSSTQDHTRCMSEFTYGAGKSITTAHSMCHKRAQVQASLTPTSSSSSHCRRASTRGTSVTPHFSLWALLLLSVLVVACMPRGISAQGGCLAFEGDAAGCRREQGCTWDGLRCLPGTPSSTRGNLVLPNCAIPRTHLAPPLMLM
jgi:hypothetical protein